MAKVTMRIPVLRFHKEEVVETPPTRRETLTQALIAQQARLTQSLTKRSAQDAIQPEQAASTATWGSRFPGIMRLSRQNPEAALKLEEAAQAYSSGSGRGRYALLALLGLTAAGAGVVAARRTSEESRAQLARRTRSYGIIVVRQTGGTGRYLGSQAMRGAAAARSRVAEWRAADIDPETITDRVRTELGEDQTLRHLPRINVNTEPGGIVYLRGTVPGETERLLAEEIARRQRGVSAVINELQVETRDNRE